LPRPPRNAQNTAAAARRPTDPRAATDRPARRAPPALARSRALLPRQSDEAYREFIDHATPLAFGALQKTPVGRRRVPMCVRVARETG
jgi:hypothetical protein